MRRSTFFFAVSAFCITFGLPLDLNLSVTSLKAQMGVISASSETRYVWNIGSVLFDFEKADIRSDAQKELSRIATIIRRYPGKSVEITGFTASEGDEDYSKQLSLRRGMAVRQWLWEQENLREIEFLCIGIGALTRDPNETAEWEQKSRRANISIMMEITVRTGSDGKTYIQGSPGTPGTQEVLFDFDKHDLRPDALEALRKVVLVIMYYNETTFSKVKKVLIEGHTDSVGGEEYNQKLSLHRAKAVKQWLQEIEYLRETEFQILGWEGSKPIASNDTAAGRQKNRRVEITILM